MVAMWRQGPQGTELISKLAQLTGADIAASDDLTGQGHLGGDWELEVQVGEVEAIALSSQTFDGVLASAWVSGSTLFFEDASADGETNEVTVSVSASNLVLSDVGGAIIAGNGLTQVGDTVQVDLNSVTGFNFSGGLGTDWVTLADDVTFANDLRISAEHITVASGVDVIASGVVDLQAIAQDTFTTVDAKHLVAAEIQLAAGSSITANRVQLHSQSTATAGTAQDGAQASVILAGQITTPGDITIEAAVNNRATDQPVLGLTNASVTSESVAIADIQPGASLTAGGLISVDTQTDRCVPNRNHSGGGGE